ncbi:type II toxin-antitoxin system VapC family toxin [bacterium]|nr:type II toxin-antitoxin system VapC family toxin [bacterium]
MGVKEFSLKLADYQVIGLDTMGFIYHFEKNPTFGPLTRTFFQHLQEGEGKSQGIISVLVVGEVLTGAKKVGNDQMILVYRHIFSTFPNLTVADITTETMEIMSDLRAKYGLRTPDTIHLATALLNKAEGFLTNDKQLRQVDELDVIIWEDYTPI